MMARRDVRPEVMDQPGLAHDLHRTALAALGRINRLSRTEAVLWRPIHRLALTSPRPIRVLDVACGGGDVLRSLARRAGVAGLPLELCGCDVSGLAVEYARERSLQEGLDEIEFVERDVLRDGLPAGFDVIACTLFLHHLHADEAERLLSSMASATRSLVLVDDLRRTRAGYLLARWGGRLLTRSPVVHVDGPLSVKAAFTEQELRDMAERTGLPGATVRRHWPQRMLLSWEKPD